jgi:NAD+ synthase (glutamine-hydrolysing)
MADATTRLRIALAQVNTTVGDVEGNAALVIEWAARARDAGAQLVVFPEQTLTGYPAEDLWLKRHFVEAASAALERIAGQLEGIIAMVGFTEAEAARHNAAAIIEGGAVRAVYRKMLLPNYEVFDERRYFDPGQAPALIEVGGALVGLTICEDIWYPGPPASVEALAGASLILNPAASPYHRGKGAYREEMLAARAGETGAAFAMCCLVGGQDELVFDGHSLVVSASGEVLARGAQFEQDLVICNLELPIAPTHPSLDDSAAEGAPARPDPPEVPVLARFDPAPAEGTAQTSPLAPLLSGEAEVYAALVLGLRDYVEKNGFERVLIAVSGGIDSALVALVAVDALGGDRVSCVVMPSPHSSAETQADARRIIANLGAELIEIPIGSAMAVYEELLGAPADGGTSSQAARFQAEDPGAGSVDLAAENVQARIRGNLVMAISNRMGWLVLTTGNKSELSVGYATLYGDMAGGFAVIKDVPKTLVYRLVRHRNEVEGRELVPASVIERAPSAELRPDQRDEDSLPPYELLDRILEAYVENDRGREEMVGDGMPADVVDEVIALVDRAEYKRRQAPPGIKITPKAFGRDRRMPITNRYRG